MLRILPLLTLVAMPASAGPAFVPRELGFVHEYAGGWEHFVGGGVAVLDCNGDAFPDLFVAGGANPARLLVNRTGAAGAPLRFVDATPPELALTGVTGAYPLDLDGDRTPDLAVLRAGPNRLMAATGGCRFRDASGVSPVLTTAKQPVP